MKNALLATDLSIVSDLLLDCLPHFKKLGIEHISLIHVPSIGFNYMEYSGYSMMVHVEARLTNMRNRCREEGFSADFVLREGLPSQEILDYASERPDVLIIMGSKGFGFSKRNLIGSTTLRVIQQSQNPVLMIRVRHSGKDESGKDTCTLDAPDLLEHAMILTDFSANASRAFVYASSHIAAHCANVGIMHIQDTVALRHHSRETIAHFNKTDAERLEKLVEHLRNRTAAPVNAHLHEGAIVPEVMRQSKMGGVSLLIMGTHGRSFYSDAVLGSNAFPLIQLAESNCLLIPPNIPSRDTVSVS